MSEFASDVGSHWSSLITMPTVPKYSLIRWKFYARDEGNAVSTTLTGDREEGSKFCSIIPTISVGQL